MGIRERIPDRRPSPKARSFLHVPISTEAIGPPDPSPDTKSQRLPHGCTHSLPRLPPRDHGSQAGLHLEGIEDTVGVPIPGVELVAHPIFVLLQGAMLRHMADADADAARLDRLLEDVQRTVLLTVADRLPEGVTL